MTPTFPVMGVVRHRLGIDGKGVTTLVGAYGCPLRCRYCLNKACWQPPGNRITPQALYDRVRIDDLYFQATGGGITFGGGEPLLYADFIHEFRRICGNTWKINLETCLNVARDSLLTVLEDVDFYIVDIKDINPQIYRSYTGQDNAQVLENLRFLAQKDPQKIRVRVPLIADFNTREDMKRSAKWLKQEGIQDIEVFAYRVNNR